MKKKTKMLIVVGAAVMVLLCAALYFRPMPLSKPAEDGGRMQLVLNKFGIENGEPEIDAETYTEITPEENSAIMAVLEQYTYRRTLETLFSDGTLDGEEILYLHLDGESIAVSTAGKAAIRGRIYGVKNARQLIRQIL